MIIDCGGRYFSSRLFLPARQEGRHYVLMHARDAGSGEKGGGEGWEMGVGWQVKKFEWEDFAGERSCSKNKVRSAGSITVK